VQALRFHGTTAQLRLMQRILVKFRKIVFESKTGQMITVFVFELTGVLLKMTGQA
jgi:hypothetical protein